MVKGLKINLKLVLSRNKKTNSTSRTITDHIPTQMPATGGQVAVHEKPTKDIVDCGEFVIWLADQALHGGPLHDVPIGMVEVFKLLIAESIESGRLVHISEFAGDVAGWFRQVSEKPQLIRCSQISELVGVLLIEMSKCSVSLKGVVELLIEWSCLKRYLEIRERRGEVTVRSRLPLQRRGIKVRVTLQRLGDESEAASNWTFNHKRPANLLFVNPALSHLQGSK